jgi:hypothetical protein
VVIAEIAVPQTKPVERNGRGLDAQLDGARPEPPHGREQRLDLAQIAARRRALAARREELVVQRAALFSTLLALREWRIELAAECRAAVRRYRDQAAARSRDRASAAELRGFKRLAVITNGRAETIRFPMARDRAGHIETSCDGAAGVIELVAGSGRWQRRSSSDSRGRAQAASAPSLARDGALFG